MTHQQISEVWPRLGMALGILGVLILVTFLLSRYLFFPVITEVREEE